MSDHENYRELAAAFVLGGLDPGERRAFEKHLAGCADCRNEVASLAPIPGLLAKLDAPVDLEPLPGSVADRAAAHAQSEWRSVDRSRRRWRLAAAAAAVLVMVTTAAALLPGADGPEPTALSVLPGPVTGEVSIAARPWGTAVHLRLDGLPPRDRYVAWVVDASGSRQAAATWGPTPSGSALVDGASSIAAERVASVMVTDGAGSEALLAADAG